MVTIWPFKITGDFNSLIRDSKREKGLAVRRVSRFRSEGTEFQKKSLNRLILSKISRFFSLDEWETLNVSIGKTKERIRG